MADTEAAAPQRRRRQRNEAQGEETAQPAAEGAAAAPQRGAGGRRRGPRRARAAAPAADGAAPAAAPAAGAADAAPPAGKIVPTEIFVRNIQRNMTKESVTALFAADSVKNTRLVRRFGRLSAHISFKTEEGATAGIAVVDNQTVEGRVLHASLYRKLSRTRSKKAPADGAEAPAAAAAAPAAAAPKKERKERKPAAAPAAKREPREPAAPATPNPLSVWIGNLPTGSTEDAVRAFFRPYGTITTVHLGANYAHVHLETAEGAAAAVTGLNGKKFGENEIKVEAARPRRPRRPAREPTNTNNLKVWVGRLQEGYDVNALSTLFAGALQIDQHDRYAYITFDTEANAQRAKDLNGHPILGMSTPASIGVARF